MSDEPGRVEIDDAEFLAAVDKAGAQAWRSLCQWFLDHPEKPLPLEVGRAALRWVAALVPDKPPSGEVVAALVDLCLSRNMSPTEAYRHVAMRLGPMKTPEAVRKDYERHRRR